MASPTPPLPVRVAVANDYELIVAGVGAMLAQHPQHVEVVELRPGERDLDIAVDVVLFDTYGSRLDGLGQLRANPCVGKVAVYTLRWDAELVRRALADGADGVLSKSLPGHQLVGNLVRIAEGQSVVDPGPAVPTFATVAPPASGAGRTWPGAEQDLTERESEVLALAASGLSNQEVGRLLHLGVNTVKTHLRNAYRKAGVRNRAQAAAYVLRQRPELQREGA